MIDIIIPILNEEKCLEEKRAYYEKLSQCAHLIFVDGGSFDQTREIAKNFGVVIQSEKGRSIQKNTGARYSKSKILLFLHVDTEIDFHALFEIEKSLKNDYIAGGMKLQIEDSRFIFRIFEWLVNVRSKYFGVLDGDLGQFVKKDVFDQVEGFNNVSCMEDILLSQKLRKKGKVFVLPFQIRVSSRIWDEYGFGSVMKEYTLRYWRYCMGFYK